MIAGIDAPGAAHRHPYQRMAEARPGRLPKPCSTAAPLPWFAGSTKTSKPGSAAPPPAAPLAVPSVLPSTTTQTGLQAARASRTVCSTIRPGVVAGDQDQMGVRVCHQAARVRGQFRPEILSSFATNPSGSPAGSKRSPRPDAEDQRQWWRRNNGQPFHR